MIALSIIICTHDPRPHYFTRVLAALRSQTLSTEQWELLVIDSASQEPLTALAWGLTWHPHARLIREEQLGLSAARMRGMREAAADLFVFVDDDNLLDPNYLVEALKIGREWPQLGVWGGSILPEFEVEPPDHLREYLSVLALREIKTPRWSNVSTCDAAEPWGAGLCVRARVAAEYCRYYEKATIRLGDRVGEALSSGGDTEICRVACGIGLGMGLFPDLRVTHVIPEERLKEDYLVAITLGIQTSLHVIDYKWRGTMPPSPLIGLNLLRFCKQLLLQRGVQKRMYLASVRARLRARNIILNGGNPDRSGRRQLEIASLTKM